MLSEQEHLRYSRQTILPEIGIAGQQLLQEAKVLVVGAGGLGCPVLQYLAAAGVGTIGIADGDVVSITNLQRQILYTTNDIGQPKAATAAERLSLLNPHVSINVHPAFIDSSNALELMRDYDIIVDGSDNFETRYLVNDACVMLGKPMVSGAIYKFEGQVSVFNYKDGPTYRCLFPQPPGVGESPNCSEIGVVATLPGIVGTIQAGEVIKMITGVGEVLSGRLLVLDTLGIQMHSFNFALNPDNLQIKELKPFTLQCNLPGKLISYTELMQLRTSIPELQVVDVREIKEHKEYNIGGVNIPVSEPGNKYAVLNKNIPVAVYCASGKRSARAANELLQEGFSAVYDLQGGIDHIKNHV